MSVSKLLKIFVACCICSNMAYTMQEQKNTEVTKMSSDYEVIQVVEFDWNSIPIMFERSPDSYCQGRYIHISNNYNKYICDIWRHRINVCMKIGSKLDYYDEEVTNKFTEVSNITRANGNWNNLSDIVHELFGNNYSVLLLG